MIVSAEGRRLLIQLVDEGHMAPQSLRTVKDLIVNADADAVSKRLVEMSVAAAAAPSQAEQAIAGRIAVFKPATGDFEKGRIIYEKNCQNCHKLRGSVNWSARSWMASARVDRNGWPRTSCCPIAMSTKLFV